MENTPSLNASNRLVSPPSPEHACRDCEFSFTSKPFASLLSPSEAIKTELNPTSSSRNRTQTSRHYNGRRCVRPDDR